VPLGLDAAYAGAAGGRGVGGNSAVTLTTPRRTSVRLVDVSKRYAVEGGELHAIDEVSLEIAAASFVSILGPSGCGKSTLLLLTAGILPATRGSIFIGEDRVTRPRTDVGFAFQQDVLLEWRRVIDNVLLQAEMRGLRRRDYVGKARELLRLVGLGDFERSYPAELSGGMRQRAALVRALVMDLPLLLLDEPFGALDAFTRDQLTVDFQQLWWALRPTVLFVTHSISEAVFLADQVVVMTPRPGRVGAVIDIDLPRPRRLDVRASSEFGAYTSRLREIFFRYGVLHEPDYGVIAT
jgi:NitT/TauT family transport system ATP-binding protein